jgi:hypothetical protein
VSVADLQAEIERLRREAAPLESQVAAIDEALARHDEAQRVRDELLVAHDRKIAESIVRRGCSTVSGSRGTHRGSAMGGNPPFPTSVAGDASVP